MLSILLFALLLILIPSCSRNEKRIGFELEENPTTGYVWNVDVKGEGSVKMVKDSYKSEGKKGMVGNGGKHTFVFEAGNDGEVLISLTHKRPWEEGYIERRTYRFEISNGRFLPQSINK